MGNGDRESALYYLRARYYDPSTAQFLSRDPMVSRTMSPYAYVAGNPLNATDPTGLDSCAAPTTSDEAALCLAARTCSSASLAQVAEAQCGAVVSAADKFRTQLANHFGSALTAAFDPCVGAGGRVQSLLDAASISGQYDAIVEAENTAGTQQNFWHRINDGGPAGACVSGAAETLSFDIGARFSAWKLIGFVTERATWPLSATAGCIAGATNRAVNGAG